MKVKFLTQAAEKAGRKEIDLPLERPISARQLLILLAESLAESAENGHNDLFDINTKALSDDYYLLLNGRHLMTLKGLVTPISDTDLVHIIPVTEAG